MLFIQSEFETVKCTWQISQPEKCKILQLLGCMCKSIAIYSLIYANADLHMILSQSPVIFLGILFLCKSLIMCFKGCCIASLYTWIQCLIVLPHYNASLYCLIVLPHCIASLYCFIVYLDSLVTMQ